MSPWMPPGSICSTCGRQQRLASAFRALRTPQLSPSPDHMHGQKLKRSSQQADLLGTEPLPFQGSSSKGLVVMFSS